MRCYPNCTNTASTVRTINTEKERKKKMALPLLVLAGGILLLVAVAVIAIYLSR